MNLNQKDSIQKKTLKAFTLVELIIVIAIIGILASMISLFVPGFVRDATLESYNKNAQMTYTGLQNCVIKWELTQDKSCVDADALGAKAYTTKDLTYAVVEFSIIGGEVAQSIIITSTYDNISANVASINLVPNPSAADGTPDKEIDKVYKKFSKMILDNMGSINEGHYRVYIDYENYQVDSAIYSPVTANKVYVQKMHWSNSPSGSTTKLFDGCYVYDMQLDMYKADKRYCGGYYPMASSVDSSVNRDGIITLVNIRTGQS